MLLMLGDFALIFALNSAFMTSDTPPAHVHFIAIGGSVMHNLALALHQQGLRVTGSDDEIREPSRTRLAAAGLLPKEEGWFPDRLRGANAVIVGMHARPDNPELQAAQTQGLPVYSFPQYVYEQCRDKQRIVIAGSHGKTTITAMIMHVLVHHGRKFDYLVGAQLEGFETMVRLTPDAPLVIIEGDEYLTSPLDATPKFLHYHHHIGLVSGIAWDHVNVYPTFEDYAHQFDRFADATPKGGILVFCEDDDLATVVCKKERADVLPIEYGRHPAQIEDGRTYLLDEHKKRVPVQFFGDHNLRNVSGAKAVCARIGITSELFYAAIPSFRGAANRLEPLAQRADMHIYKDFAHAPSKLRATCEAVRQQFPQHRLVACLELHTFSSLNPAFLDQYRKTFKAPDVAMVYFNPKVLAHKQLPPLSAEQVQTAFARPDLQVYTDRTALEAALRAEAQPRTNWLLMSSGHFDGLDLNKFCQEVLNPVS